MTSALMRLTRSPRAVPWTRPPATVMQHVADSSFDPAQDRMGAPATARVGGESPLVAYPVSNEWHHPIRRTGQHDVTRLTGFHRLPVPQDLHLDVLGEGMQRTGWTFVAYRAGLAAAVGLDNPGAQAFLDFLPLKLVDQLAEDLDEWHQRARLPGCDQSCVTRQLRHRGDVARDVGRPRRGEIGHRLGQPGQRQVARQQGLSVADPFGQGALALPAHQHGWGSHGNAVPEQSPIITGPGPGRRVPVHRDAQRDAGRAGGAADIVAAHRFGQHLRAAGLEGLTVEHGPGEKGIRVAAPRRVAPRSRAIERNPGAGVLQRPGEPVRTQALERRRVQALPLLQPPDVRSHRPAAQPLDGHQEQPVESFVRCLGRHTGTRRRLRGRLTSATEAPRDRTAPTAPPVPSTAPAGTRVTRCRPGSARRCASPACWSCPRTPRRRPD